MRRRGTTIIWRRNTANDDPRGHIGVLRAPGRGRRLPRPRRGTVGKGAARRGVPGDDELHRARDDDADQRPARNGRGPDVPRRDPARGAPGMDRRRYPRPGGERVPRRGSKGAQPGRFFLLRDHAPPGDPVRFHVRRSFSPVRFRYPRTKTFLRTPAQVRGRSRTSSDRPDRYDGNPRYLGRGTVSLTPRGGG